MPKNDYSKLLLCIAAVTEWELLKEDTLLSLIESMPRRMQAVVQSRGWYTKY